MSVTSFDVLHSVVPTLQPHAMFLDFRSDDVEGMSGLKGLRGRCTEQNGVETICCETEFSSLTFEEDVSSRL